MDSGERDGLKEKGLKRLPLRTGLLEAGVRHDCQLPLAPTSNWTKGWLGTEPMPVRSAVSRRGKRTPRRPRTAI